jgi:hypothetical protein
MKKRSLTTAVPMDIMQPIPHPVRARVPTRAEKLGDNPDPIAPQTARVIARSTIGRRPYIFASGVQIKD